MPDVVNLNYKVLTLQKDVRRDVPRWRGTFKCINLNTIQQIAGYASGKELNRKETTQQ